jgi:hypothetical protein
MNFRNKLEYLSLASISSLVQCLRVRAEPTRVKTFQVPHSRVGSWPYIRLGWKGLPVTNALAYYENSQLTATKSLITLAPGEMVNHQKVNLLDILYSGSF